MMRIHKIVPIEFCLEVAKGDVPIMAWWRKGSLEEDQVFVQSVEAVTKALADSDYVREVELRTGKNLRDQVTAEEIEEMHKEAKLRSMGPIRN